MTEPPAGRENPSRPRLRATGLTVFLGVLLVIMAGYTQMAMGMQWRTPAGRIGAGFFPRIVGFCAIAFCLVAALRSLRPSEPDEENDDEPSPRLHPWLLLVFAGAAVLFLMVLVPLGAIPASALFLLATLWLLDRSHLVRHLAIAVLLPIALYLLFQVGLNAGLPTGILPIF